MGSEAWSGGAEGWGEGEGAAIRFKASLEGGRWGKMWAPGVGGNYNSQLCVGVSGGRGDSVILARGEVCLLQGSTRYVWT